MSTKKPKDLRTKLQEFDELMSWFEADDFDIEIGLSKYKQAQKLSDGIAQHLDTLGNEIVVLKQSFEKQ